MMKLVNIPRVAHNIASSFVNCGSMVVSGVFVLPGVASGFSGVPGPAVILGAVVTGDWTEVTGCVVVLSAPAAGRMTAIIRRMMQTGRRTAFFISGSVCISNNKYYLSKINRG
jgi:hypothetical protein